MDTHTGRLQVISALTPFLGLRRPNKLKWVFKFTFKVLLEVLQYFIYTTPMGEVQMRVTFSLHQYLMNFT